MTFSFVCPGPARIRRDIGSFVSRTVRVRFRHWPAPGCAYSNHRAVTRADSYQWHANRSPWALRPLLRNRRISGKPCVCVCIFYHIHIYAIVPSDLYPSVETHPLRGRVSLARTTTELPSSSLMAPFSSERDRETERVFRFCSCRLFVGEILGGNVQIARSSYLILIKKEDYWGLWIQRGMNTVFSINFLFFWGEIGRRFVSPPKRRWTIIGNYQFVETRLMGTASYYVQISSVSVRSRLNVGNLLRVFFFFRNGLENIVNRDKWSRETFLRRGEKLD